MRFALLIPIRFYWWLIPATKRNNCLFRESCSRSVYRITKEKGFTAGCRALILRFKRCRPGYTIGKTAEGKLLLTFRDGSSITEENIAEQIIWTNQPMLQP